MFSDRVSIEQVEEGTELGLKFDSEGLIPVATTAAEDGTLLMVGCVNREALEETIQTGEAHYFSQNRQVLWHKGATSGLVLKVAELSIDDDQDAVGFGSMSPAALAATSGIVLLLSVCAYG